MTHDLKKTHILRPVNESSRSFLWPKYVICLHIKGQKIVQDENMFYLQCFPFRNCSRENLHSDSNFRWFLTLESSLPVLLLLSNRSSLWNS